MRLATSLIVSLAVAACVGPEDDPVWCHTPDTANQGLETQPDVGARLLGDGLVIDPELVRCPAPDYSDWVPFVGRHSSGYTTDPRFAGLDDSCVPVVDLEGRYEGVEETQTPLVVANYGLLRYGDLIRGFTPDEIPEPCRDPVEAVLAQARWLEGRADRRSFSGTEHWAFLYDFPNPQGGLEAPWTSGYAQGIAAPAFVAAWCVSEDPRWLDAATKSLRGLTVRMADGGTATWESEDALWFEEAAALDARSARSLNGHLAAAAGVHAVAAWTAAPGILELRDLAFQAALTELENYDAGFISLYTQWATDHPLIAPARDYNRFHVQQLSWLHSVTGDPRALDMALRFARYDDPRWSWTAPSGEPPDFIDNEVYVSRWTVEGAGVLEVDLGSAQDVSGLVLWSDDPSMTPGALDFELSLDGDTWETRSAVWDASCHDLRWEFDALPARYGRITLEPVGAPVDGPAAASPPGATGLVSLRGVGVLRERRHPAAVADWLNHGVFNRPAGAFGSDGWTWSRKSSVLFDLDGTFGGGELTMSGWRAAVPPVLLGSDVLAEGWSGFSDLEIAPTIAGQLVSWALPDSLPEYLRVVIDTPSNPGEVHQMFLRQSVGRALD